MKNASSEKQNAKLTEESIPDVNMEIEERNPEVLLKENSNTNNKLNNMEIEEKDLQILSKENNNVNNNSSNNMNIPMPGKGKKILFISTNQTRMV
ncbi:MAG TPA: hypothetical protein VGD31_03470 [Sphingobacteriaceae bacterium]